MNSISNIVKRLRESKMNESINQYEYKFNIPWREVIQYDDYELYHHEVRHMEYPSDIMDAAKKDFNEVDWLDYLPRDSRTKDCGITAMSMDFDSEGKCIITVATDSILEDDKIESIKSYLEGQMSDGWGEGFEQREIVSYQDSNEEWVEDYDDEDGGYYDEVITNIYVSGQFWWYKGSKPYEIILVSTPQNNDKSTNESINTEGDIGSQIREDIMKELKRFMTSPSIGFEEDEVSEYSAVDISLQSHSGQKFYVVEVRAELSYDALTELSEVLDKVVSRYSKDAYFEAVTSGIIEAWIEIN